MKDMKGSIMLTSIRKGKKCTCINYLLLNKDYLVDNEYCKGFTDLTSFTNNEIINDFNTEDFLKILDCTFKEVQDYKNPLNTQLRLETITLKNGKIINLL